MTSNPEDKSVDGNTFQAYSVPTIIANLETRQLKAISVFLSEYILKKSTLKVGDSGFSKLKTVFAAHTTSRIGNAMT